MCSIIAQKLASARSASHFVKGAQPPWSHAQLALYRWFYFRVTGCKDKSLHLKIVNAGESSFPVAWPDYNTCASYDGINMFRVPTEYDQKKGSLSWKITPDHVSFPGAVQPAPASLQVDFDSCAHVASCMYNIQYIP